MEASVAGIDRRPSTPMMEGVDNELRARLAAELDQTNAELNELEERLRERRTKRDALSAAVNVMDEAASDVKAMPQPVAG